MENTPSFPIDEFTELQKRGSVDGVVKTCPSAALEVAMFFDGTGNNLANVMEGNDIRASGGQIIEGSHNNDYSNVAKLYRVYRPYAVDIRDDCGGIGKIRRAEIIDGIGTTSGQGDSTFGNALGWGQPVLKNE